MEDLAKNILEKLASLAYGEVSLAWGMKDDLNKLKKTTSILKAVLQDAESKQAQNEEIRIWLTELKVVFHDAVDVLDDFECELLRRQVVKQYASFGRKVRRFFSSSNPLAYRFSVAHRVKDIRENLDEIAKNMGKFNLIKSTLNVEQSPLMQESRETHSFVNLSDVIGRDREKGEILDMVLMDQAHTSDNQISVISIVGLGGLGKTTLIKAVYNDKQIGGKFDLRIWVCVSLDFNVSRIIKDILKDATGSSGTSDMSNLNQLQKSLTDTLKDKKFLLVLDDVWNKDSSKWQDLAESLSVGSKGSKIIVTTRDTDVASIMCGKRQYELEGLPDKDSLSLFFKFAFRSEEEAAKYPELKQIGEEIMRKCGGVPLALKTLGSLIRLKKTEAREWKIVRDSRIWELEREKGHILPALRLSYNPMPPSLKHCFAYCSTFEEGSWMVSIDLICIWMALGILHSPNNKVELEDVGKSHCMELCNRSFFQVDCEAYYGLSQFFRVHDLIHNLACSITQSECSTVDYEGGEISDTLRYLRIVINKNNLTNLSKLTKLRSIHVKCTGDEKDEVVESFLSTCISRFKHLRLFDLSDLSFEVFPSSIGTVKQLRYLNMSDNRKIKRLPDSICKLQSLQTLIVSGCEKLEELPKNIGNLVSLRTLMLTTKQCCLAYGGIGRLKSIRLLVITKCKNLRALPNDLINCTTLRTLVINYCKQLNLASGFINEDVQLSLQTFVIDALPETTDLPQWLQQAAKTLQNLRIEHCSKLARLPWWLPKLISLEKLLIMECPKLMSLPRGMERLTSLTHLKIEDCEQLNLASEFINEDVQSSLHTFVIKDLPETIDLPQWLQQAAKTLQNLQIEYCSKLARLPEWLPKLISLEKLLIRKCPRLMSLPEGMERLTSLTHLKIEDCDALEERCK
ncbi:putative disease resistance protein RGA3 [Humulus lupulus]|uniref:putative disease resistance protein RGA3 n=1 Tax=Humulus lupulus TaxID=3486 RepID=UPI002B413E12|nr:putative disease resistance protein RGA3 [Humulus lupulus]